MISEQQQEEACLYALGALTPSEKRDFEAEMAVNSELADLARNLQATLALVAGAIPAIPLPFDLKEKMLKRIQNLDAANGSREISPPVPPGLSFIGKATQTGWKRLPIPGAFVKLLSLERERGYAVLLGKLEPGARYPAHGHANPENFYILTGDLVVGSRKLVAGDFHHADRGSQHEENYSVDGCTLLAVVSINDPLVSLAMS